MSREYNREQYIQEQNDRKAELSELIKNISLNFEEDIDSLTEYLAFQQKFHNYSYKNTVLIYEQNQGASFVGSFLKFKEMSEEIAKENNLCDDKGRPLYLGVKKGEKGMTIFVPAEVTLGQFGEDWIKLSACSDEQKRQIKNGEVRTRKELHFKLGTVFDISQTAIPAEYYPLHLRLSWGYDSEQHKYLYEGLKEYIETDLGCPVERNFDNSLTLRGRCYTQHKEIDLNSRLKDTQMLSTLAHELGHFLMHSDFVSGTSGTATSAAQKEVEADIYSIMLDQHFGIEITDARKRHLKDSYSDYLSSYKEAEQNNRLEIVINNAVKTFDKTIEQIDARVSMAVERRAAETTLSLDEQQTIIPAPRSRGR